MAPCAHGADRAARRYAGMSEAGSILVVDDDPINRRLLARALDALGHTVVTASNGLEALEVLRVQEPDVVLLDIVMPEMDGVAVLERIKADPQLRAVPVIMVSALEDV